MNDKLLNQVLEELDYAVGELQRAKVTIMMVSKTATKKEIGLFKRIVECIDNRIKSGKAMMILAEYTPIAYRGEEESK